MTDIYRVTSTNNEMFRTMTMSNWEVYVVAEDIHEAIEKATSENPYLLTSEICVSIVKSAGLAART